MATSRLVQAAIAALLPTLVLLQPACEPPLPPLTPPPIPAAALLPGGPSGPPAAGGFGAPQVTPPVVEAEVAQAESLGARLFAHALFTRKAENALREARLLSADGQAPATVVIERGEGGVVHVLGEEGGAVKTLFRVAIADRGGEELHVETQPPPAPEQPVAAAALARRTVMREWASALPNEYRSFVLSAPGDRPGWLVYLIAEPERANQMMLGGHHRFRVSADGATVQERFAFSRNALLLPLDAPGGASVAGLWTTHLTTDAPTETHVYLSLVHRVPLEVGTRLGVWDVRAGAITFLGAMGSR